MMNKRLIAIITTLLFSVSVLVIPVGAVDISASNNELSTTMIQLERTLDENGNEIFMGSCEIPAYYIRNDGTRELVPTSALLFVFYNRNEGEMQVVVEIVLAGLIQSASVFGISTFGDLGGRTAGETSARNIVPLPAIEIVQDFSGFNPYITTGVQHVTVPVGSFIAVGGGGVFGPIDAAFEIEKWG